MPQLILGDEYCMRLGKILLQAVIYNKLKNEQFLGCVDTWIQVFNSKKKNRNIEVPG